MNRYIQSVIVIDLYQGSWCLNIEACLINLCAYARLRDIKIYSGMSSGMSEIHTSDSRDVIKVGNIKHSLPSIYFPHLKHLTFQPQAIPKSVACVIVKLSLPG